jgi:hypothetical protein
MECDWCHKVYEPRRVNKGGKHFCCSACRTAYNRWVKKPYVPVPLMSKTLTEPEPQVKSDRSKRDEESVSQAVLTLRTIGATLTDISSRDERLAPVCDQIADGIFSTLEGMGL